MGEGGKGGKIRDKCFTLETLLGYGSNVELFVGTTTPLQNCLWCKSNGVCVHLRQVSSGSLRR